jgi:maltose-binding protein MalE
MTSAEYQQTFYPIAYESLQANGGIVGLPLMYDGLALFINKEMLANANCRCQLPGLSCVVLLIN